MKLPSFRRLFEQDYPPDYQELVRQLSVSINYGFEPLYELLNGKFSFTDNSASIIRTFNVQVDASGKPTTKTVIQKTSTDRFEGFVVIQAQNITNSSVYPTGGVFISYTETTSTVVIDNITGLPPGNIFTIKVFGLR